MNCLHHKSQFQVQKRGRNEQIVFTTTLSVTALFHISKSKKVTHYCMVNNLFNLNTFTSLIIFTFLMHSEHTLLIINHNAGRSFDFVGAEVLIYNSSVGQWCQVFFFFYEQYAGGIYQSPPLLTQIQNYYIDSMHIYNLIYLEMKYV